MTTTLITGETWGDNVDSVRAHLLSEAEQPFSALVPKLRAAHEEFRRSLDGVDEAQAQLEPASGEGEDAWGIAEVLRHIASIEPIMADRIRLLGDGQSVESLRPTHPGYHVDVETRSLAELRDILETSARALLDAIDSIDGHERLDTLAAHRRFGELNCRGWTALHTLHLRDHARQVERLKAQLSV